MDERSILMAQIQALMDELNHVKKALDEAPVDPNLRERMRSKFDFDLQILEKYDSLKNLQADVEQDQPLATCWSLFVPIRQDCVPLFRECLAFIQGAMTRRTGLDGGLCRIADALLDNLGRRAGISWEFFTILAEGESYADMAQIIRLRFPEVSIWNLPIACHEFGHYVAKELKKRRQYDGTYYFPFQELLDSDPQNAHFLHEHFADLFATYTVGPAYACTCILLRFDPYTAYSDEPRHPSYAKRVHFILKALEKMNGEERPYSDIIEHLRSMWQKSLVAADQPDHLNDDNIGQLNILLEDMYALIEPSLSKAKYTSWFRAQSLSYDLLLERDAAQLLRVEDRISDVFNAAWICRIRHWKENSQISQKALKLCHEIIQRGVEIPQRRNP